MDISDLYIEQCRKSLEIQERWVCAPGDYIFCHEAAKTYCLAPAECINKKAYHWYRPRTERCIGGGLCSGYKAEHVWLPRQDQLQDLTFSHKAKIYSNLSRFRKFVLHRRLYTFEQAWLSFFMYSKYRKVWYSGGWFAPVQVANGLK